MSNAALGTDGKPHYATDFQGSYSGGYFCPNPDCGVHMSLKNIGSDEKEYLKIRPYFSASKEEPHIEGCPFANTCISDESLKTADFVADDFFTNLQIRQSGAVETLPASGTETNPQGTHNAITTLNQLYHYCLQHRDDDVLPDGTQIFEIFQEDRNKHILNWSRHTSKLVKLRFINCNDRDFDLDKRCYKMWCMFPHTEKTRPPGIYYTLGFREESKPLMRYFDKILTPLKRKTEDTFLLVGGEWHGNHCYLTSKRQIFILQSNYK